VSQVAAATVDRSAVRKRIGRYYMATGTQRDSNKFFVVTSNAPRIGVKYQPPATLSTGVAVTILQFDKEGGAFL
jgi:hypothetical protein